MNMIKQAIKKALQSPCRHKVSAVAYDHKGDVLGFTVNTRLFQKKGGGIHAEQKAIAIWGSRIKTLLICRTNISGQLLPIHPCEKCLKAANKHGIAIKTIEDKERFEEYNRKHSKIVEVFA